MLDYFRINEVNSNQDFRNDISKKLQVSYEIKDGNDKEYDKQKETENGSFLDIDSSSIDNLFQEGIVRQEDPIFSLSTNDKGIEYNDVGISHKNDSDTPSIQMSEECEKENLYPKVKSFDFELQISSPSSLDLSLPRQLNTNVVQSDCECLQLS
eukprot:TRINITY_DN9312_c0_g2_i1.p2 TRINITY_DN9312_c0_g2~~TRINITY_DN9312_c0_g2_i1.p2  ORF type:complete len:154 (-),score=14.13 TRINITY_DN9312_c0_g2_i1:63-524(-)